MTFRGGSGSNAAYAMMYQQPDNQVAFAWHRRQRFGVGDGPAGGTSTAKFLRLIQAWEGASKTGSPALSMKTRPAPWRKTRF